MSKTAKRVLAIILASIMMLCTVSAVDLPKFKVYSVTDGGGYIVILKTEYQVGETVVARAVPNEGYAFYAWSSDDITFNKNQANDMIEFIMPAKDVTLGAIFAIKQPEQKETVAVTFDSMGGTDFGTTYVEVGGLIARPENVPTKAGYTFEGWFADAVCTMPFDFSTPIYASTFIYAKWAPIVNDPVEQNGFGDVKPGDWYYESIMALSERNILSGMGNGIFAPTKNITRAQFATILAKLAKANLSSSETPFGDVPQDAWYAKAVAWAYNNSVVNGVSEDKFAPNANVTRQDMAVMIMRYVNSVAKVTLSESNTQTAFADDAKIAAYAREAVYSMQRAGVIGGKPGNEFDPKAYATRAEASKMIYVLLGLIER